MSRAKPIRKGDLIQVMHQGHVFRATCTDARAGIISVAREFVPEEISKAWFKRAECQRLAGPETPSIASMGTPDAKGWWINRRKILDGAHSIPAHWWNAKGVQALMSQDRPANTDGWIFASDPSAGYAPVDDRLNDEEEE